MIIFHPNLTVLGPWITIFNPKTTNFYPNMNIFDPKLAFYYLNLAKTEDFLTQNDHFLPQIVHQWP